MLYFKNFSSLS